MPNGELTTRLSAWATTSQIHENWLLRIYMSTRLPLVEAADHPLASLSGIGSGGSDRISSLQPSRMMMTVALRHYEPAKPACVSSNDASRHQLIFSVRL